MSVRIIGDLFFDKQNTPVNSQHENGLKRNIRVAERGSV